MGVSPPVAPYAMMKSGSRLWGRPTWIWFERGPTRQYAGRAVRGRRPMIEDHSQIAPVARLHRAC